MNAAEARKKRGGSTLLERVKSDPSRAAQINKLAQIADVERLVQKLMLEQHVSAAELARRVDVKAPQISRDLHGGLRKASLTRIAGIVDALGYDFLPALVPREHSPERDTFLEAYRALLPPDSAVSQSPKRAPRRKVR